MDLIHAHKPLAIYIENSHRILDASFGVDRAERSFFDVIELLRGKPGLRPAFIQAFDEAFVERNPRSLDDGSLPREQIEIATHELRWREFGEVAQQRIEQRFGGESDGMRARHHDREQQDRRMTWGREIWQ